MDSTSTSSPNRRPLVLWVVDNPEWAYASIVRNVGEALPQYRHQMWCCMARVLPNDGQLLHDLIQEADIVVSMFLLYQRGVPDPMKDKVAMMLTGMRPFEV